MTRKRAALICILLCISLLFTACQGGVVAGSIFDEVKQFFVNFMEQFEEQEPDPMDFLREYIGYLNDKNYGKAYSSCLTENAQRSIALAAYVEKHQNIFSAIELTGIEIAPLELTVKDTSYHQRAKVTYKSGILGSFEQSIDFRCEYDSLTGSFLLYWDYADLFEQLEKDDVVRLNTLVPLRGEIIASDHTPYAVNSYAESVNIRLSQMGDREETLAALVPLLQMEREELEKLIDSTQAQKYDGITLRAYLPGSLDPDTESALTSIAGVTVNRTSSTPIRHYPEGEALSHMIGYVSPVTAEELAESPDLYDITSNIGRAGLEAEYEETLRGEKGFSLDIYDKNQVKKASVYTIPAVNGLDLEITIDEDLQKRADTLLAKLPEGRSGVILALEPSTGDLLAASNYPSFNPNYFSFSSTPEARAALNSYVAEDSNSPLLNRITQGRYVPGSTVKPFIAAMALDNDVISVNTEFPGRIRQNKWDPAETFGSFDGPAITRIDYNQNGPLDMYQAIAKSDNIYFAYVALLAGWNKLEPFLLSCGFGETIPFDLKASSPNYINSEQDKTKKRLLADTGYGQGHWLISPLQMAYTFSAFANNAKIMEPRLVKSTRELDGINYNVVDSFDSKVWKDEIFSSYSMAKIEPMLNEVFISGSGRNAKIDGLKLCGKTGTAEIGNDKKNELHWFIGYVDEGDYERLVLVMLELPSDYEGTLRQDAMREMLMP